MSRSWVKSNPDAMYAFALSLAFVVIDATAFVLAAEPLSRVLTVAPPLGDWLHALAVFFLGSLVCCVAFLAFPRKRKLVPWAFSFFVVYLLAGCAMVCFGLPAESRPAAWELLGYCGVMPTVAGLGTSWPLYRILEKRAAARRKP